MTKSKAKTKSIKLSFQAGKGFKKSIGTHKGKDGKLKWKMWWLGEYQEPAERLAKFITQEWKQLKAAKVDHWTDDALLRIELFKGGKLDADSVSTIQAPIQTGIPIKISSKQNKTTHQAMDLYNADYKASSTRSASTKNVAKWWIEILKKDIPNVPLSSVGAIEIQSYINHYASLPMGVKTQKPISPDTADNLIKMIKRVFDWCDLMDIWRAPRRFSDLFNVNPKKNIAGKTNPIFDIFELKALHDGANESQKLYLLLMLNCCFTSIDISTLRYNRTRSLSKNPDDYSAGETLVFPSDEFSFSMMDKEKDDSDIYLDWYIAGKRTKTNVFGIFPLWKETACLLAKRMKATPRNIANLAMLSESGTSLVHSAKDLIEGSRTDAIGLSMRRLIRAANKSENGCRLLKAKSLRKTGSQFIRDIAGLEVSQIALRQTGRSVAERFYNNANFDKLEQAIHKMRESLGTMFGE